MNIIKNNSNRNTEDTAGGRRNGLPLPADILQHRACGSLYHQRPERSEV